MARRGGAGHQGLAPRGLSWPRPGGGTRTCGSADCWACGTLCDTRGSGRARGAPCGDRLCVGGGRARCSARGSTRGTPGRAGRGLAPPRPRTRAPPRRTTPLQQTTLRQ
ncbi:hypothetical protein E2C01_024248 [Portunus trituberculatus]|uniref:Uncharacterized protein n=1 Tax=Portunus trituberculatus TaxID=210409 RepID=A0A5B7ECN2_PORTR|nr:hypothetical protein [Portunus trituberculatus]